MRTAGTNDFNLGLRLTLTFAALVALIVGGNALVVWQFHLIRNQTDRLTGANQQLIEVLRLQASLLSFHRQLDDLSRSMDVRRLVTEAESLRRAVHEQTQQTRTAIANLPSGTVVDPSFLPTLDTIEVTLPSELEAILELAKSGDWAVIHARVGSELNPIETQTAILVNSINQQASGELARGVAEMRSVQRRILVIVPAIALSTFFIAAFLSWSIARRFIELRLDERVNERTRIAHELHDTLLQEVQSASMQLNVANDQLGQESPAKPLVERVLGLMQGAIEDARNAVRSLRPSKGETEDLDEAFSRIPRELEAQGVADFRVIVEGSPHPLRPLIRDEVYRIGREAVVNAFRHSGATSIEVALEYEAHQLRLLVRDNGGGIDPHVLQSGVDGHWGLQGMRERAERTGAKLKVWSSPARGTEVELRIPGRIAFESRPARDASNSAA